MTSKFILIISIYLTIVACGQPTNIKPDYRKQLANALYLKDFDAVNRLMKTIKLSENTQNLINTNQIMHQGSEPRLQKELNYLKQFYSQMNPTHQTLYNQLHQWLLLKQIYRVEISPPVRILQREELYLAPSNINFNVCQTTAVRCAKDQRKKLIELITEIQISDQLKKMALKDPCVNLSNSLKGSTQANRCLKSSKGDLQIELLAKPFLTQSKWLQVITSE